MKRILFLIAVCWAAFGISAQPRSEEQAKQIARVSHRHRVKEIELYRGDSISFENSNGMKWSSSDQYVAKVNNGIIIGNHLGTAIVTISNSITKEYVIVKVKPKYMLYDNPIMDFGLSRQSIIERETHRLISDVADSLDLVYDYSHDQFEVMMFYHFGSKNELKSVMAAVQNDSDFEFNGADAMITGFFDERFQLLSKEEDSGYILIDRLIDNINGLISLEKSLTKTDVLPNDIPLVVRFVPTKVPNKWIKVTYNLPQREASEVHFNAVISGKDKDKWGDFLSRIISHSDK